MEENQLRVDDAYNKDELRGIARIDEQSMNELGLADGDIIEILGNKEALATCCPLFEQDKGRKVIRIDRITQHNAGLQTGDLVSIKKVAATTAQEITLDPVETAPPMDSRYVIDSLHGVVLTKGNKCVIPYFGGHIAFKVTETTPLGNIIVKNDYTSCVLTKDASSNPSLNMQVQNIIQDILKLDTLTEDELGNVIDRLKKVHQRLHDDAFRYPRK